MACQRKRGKLLPNPHAVPGEAQFWVEWSREKIRDFLTTNRQALMCDLEPWNFFPYLRTKKVIDRSTQERVEGKYISTFEKMGHLLDVIECKGAAGFHAFMEMFECENPILFLQLTGKEAKPKDPQIIKESERTSHSQAMVQKMLKLITDVEQQNQQRIRLIKECEQDYQSIQQVEEERELQKVNRRQRELSRKVREFEERTLRFKQKYEEQQEMRIKKSLECMELIKQRDDQYEQTMTLREKLADTELRLKAASGKMIRHNSSKQSPQAVNKMREEILHLKHELDKQRADQVSLAHQGSSSQVLQELQKMRCAAAELERERDQLVEERAELKDQLEEAETCKQNNMEHSELYKQQAQQMKAERNETQKKVEVCQAKQEEAEKSCEELEKALHYYRSKCKAMEQQVVELELEKKQLRSLSRHPELKMYDGICEPQPAVDETYASIDRPMYDVALTGRGAEKIEEVGSDDEDVKEPTVRPPPVPGKMVARRPSKSKKIIEEHHLLPATMFGHQVEIIDLYGAEHRSREFVNRAYSLHEVKVTAEFLQQNVTLIGGNLIGIFVSEVKGTCAQDCGLDSGDQICMIKAQDDSIEYNLEHKPLEDAQQVVQCLHGELSIIKGVNVQAYQALKRSLNYFKGKTFTGDFFCVMVRNNSTCWTDEHLQVSQNTILLVTNTAYSENNWFATIVNPPDGTTLDHGLVPSVKKKLNRTPGFRLKHSRSLELYGRQNTQQDIYNYIKPYEACYQRPLFLCGNPALVTPITELLRSDSQFTQITTQDLGLADWTVDPPGSPRTSAESSSKDSSTPESKPELPSTFVAKVQGTSHHILLPPSSLIMLSKMRAADIYPICIQLEEEGVNPPKAVSEVISQLKQHEYDTLSVSVAMATDLKALADEVKAKVIEIQDHLIWVTNNSPKACV